VDYDVSSAPILADITVNVRRSGSRGTSKEAFLYVFDRVTGKPVWPIEERPVPQSTVPGEKTSPTQPFPHEASRVCPPADQGSRRSDRIHAGAARRRDEAHRALQVRADVQPPSLATSDGSLGTAYIGNGIGGTNWTGGAYDPERTWRTHPPPTPLLRRWGSSSRPKEFSDIRYLRGIKGQPFGEAWGPGDCCAADSGSARAMICPGRRRRAGHAADSTAERAGGCPSSSLRTD